jgi:bifunctional non-homologous end joining protein LigD
MKWIEPMEPIICTEVKEDTQYIHEVKWDGIRGMVYLENNKINIYSKRGNERTAFYPELYVLLDVFKSQKVIFDGELIVLDDEGLPSFHNSLVRETVKSEKNLRYYMQSYPVKYMIFDVLYYKKQLLTQVPLFERKQLLPHLLQPLIDNSDTIALSESYSNGEELYRQMKKKNMEGIVSKKITSTYISGKKHEAWFKTKFIKKMLCIVGGIQLKCGNVNSLILGIRVNENDDSLTYMGKASIGLKESDFKLLKEFKNELMQTRCPFDLSALQPINAPGTEIIWVNPVITCWVSFLELSDAGHFRHPKIEGFSQLPAVKADGKVIAE